jgi:hypothetical protein
MSGQRWLGIDFSGNHLKWRPRCTTSNVWISDVRRDDAGLRLHDVRRVQQLPGSGAPFNRLAALLTAGEYEAAGIDAPFSVPEVFVRRVGGHAALVKLVGGQTIAGRPFVKGADMVRLVAGVAPPLTPPKPMRQTDAFWAELGVNVRSPIWTGARPGAPMTAACLTLLHRAGRPMWPWSSERPGLLVEAFPAGQLRTWGLPHEGYDGPSTSAVAKRTGIIHALAGRLRLGTWRPILLGSADALDGVICAFAAVAVSASRISMPGSASIRTEGWVAAHPMVASCADDGPERRRVRPE